MTINPRILLIITAIGVAIYFTQKNNSSDLDTTASKDAEQKSQSENTTPKPKSSHELLSNSITAINFPDKELEKCVFDEIREGSDSENKKDIANITKLHCQGHNIMSLEGIEKLSSLQKATFIGTDIQDASPLSSLNSLTNIYLNGGNENIQNIDSLSQLSNLKKINFPHMMQTYCYEAQSVIQSMKENIDGPTSNNLNLVHCRGKKTHNVTSALLKIESGEDLTSAESEALDDYEANKNWSE